MWLALHPAESGCFAGVMLLPDSLALLPGLLGQGLVLAPKDVDSLCSAAWQGPPCLLSRGLLQSKHNLGLGCSAQVLTPLVLLRTLQALVWAVLRKLLLRLMLVDGLLLALGRVASASSCEWLSLLVLPSPSSALLLDLDLQRN